jgi:uncharacterized protein YukE
MEGEGNAIGGSGSLGIYGAGLDYVWGKGYKGGTISGGIGTPWLPGELHYFKTQTKTLWGFDWPKNNTPLGTGTIIASILYPLYAPLLVATDLYDKYQAAMATNTSSATAATGAASTAANVLRTLGVTSVSSGSGAAGAMSKVLKVSTGVVRSKLDSFRSKRQHLSGIMQQIKDIMRQLATVRWMSPASRSFLQQFNKFSKQIDEALLIVDEYIYDLEFVLKHYSDVEQRTTEKMNVLRTDVFGV